MGGRETGETLGFAFAGAWSGPAAGGAVSSHSVFLSFTDSDTWKGLLPSDPDGDTLDLGSSSSPVTFCEWASCSATLSVGSGIVGGARAVGNRLR